LQLGVLGLALGSAEHRISFSVESVVEPRCSRHCLPLPVKRWRRLPVHFDVPLVKTTVLEKRINEFLKLLEMTYTYELVSLMTLLLVLSLARSLPPPSGLPSDFLTLIFCPVVTRCFSSVAGLSDLRPFLVAGMLGIPFPPRSSCE